MLDSHPSAFASDGELRPFGDFMCQADDKFLPLGSFNGYDMLSAGDKSCVGYAEPMPAAVLPSEVLMPDYISPQSLDAHNGSSETNKHLGDQTQPIQVETPTDSDTQKTPPEPPRRRGRPRKAKLNKPSHSPQNNNAVTQQPTPSLQSTTSHDQASGEQDLGPDDDKKRLRARNRESAKRFRIRKRDGIEKLRDKEDKARKTNEHLVEEAAKLRDETLELKSMVLQHAGCGCSFIEEYIGNMAANLAQNISPRHAEPQTGPSPSFSMSNDAFSMTDVEE